MAAVLRTIQFFHKVISGRNRLILHMPMRESGDLCRVCNGVPKLRNATVRLIMPIPLSVCSFSMINLSRNIFGFF